jgi:hypothetical protein
MPLEERATSWALSLFDALESPTQTKGRVLAAAAGTFVTIGMWAVHLSYPEIFSTLLQSDDWAKLLLGCVLAPPFAVAFSVGAFIYRPAIERVKNESGPMSGYFYQQKENKRWRLLIIAGIVAALNFLLMMVTAASLNE